VRYVLFAVMCFTLISCREIQTLSFPVSIKGYQLNGSLTAVNGVPIGGTEVRLYYNYEIVALEPADTQVVMVTNPTRIVDIAVYTEKYAFVKQLYLGYMQVGPVPRARWTGVDYKGNFVPSGKYYIRYVLDTVIVKYSPVLVEGAVTAYTDETGKFKIVNDNLPVGEIFDFYRPDGTFYGVLRVLPDIGLQFRKQGAGSDYPSVSLLENEITMKSFIL